MNPLDIALQESMTAQAHLLARIYNLAIENMGLKETLRAREEELAKLKKDKATLP